MMVGLAGCSSPSSSPSPIVTSPPTPAVESVSPTHALPPSVSGDKFLLSDAPTSTSYPNSWTVLTNIGYESAYDETFRNPVWVAYHLPGRPVAVLERPNSNYPTDTRTTSLVTATDYPAGYDHGHMAPNYSIALYFGEAAQAETFLMSNMLAQKPGLNRGPWKSLETLEYTNWAISGHELWVICGPVYTTADDQPINPTERYGAKAVCIPVACFKIEIMEDEAGGIRTLAFIMPQNPGTGHKPKDYLTSIREIERRTGLNFFSTWTKAKQDALETVTAGDVWQ